MKSRFSFPLLVFVNTVSVAIFFLPLFIRTSSESLQDILAPVSISLVAISAISCIVLSHSQMTSRALLTLSAIACAFGVMGRLFDLPAGGSGMFFVVIVSGIALGSNFGQLVGMSSMFVSALLTGGVGPWLGYQAIAMGLVGAAAGILSPLVVNSVRRNGSISRSTFTGVVVFSGVLGLFYGFLANWWSWPFLDYGKEISFNSAASFSKNVSHYFTFYLRTSLWWDAWALIGNVAAMLFFGRHVITALLPAREFLNPNIEFLDSETPSKSTVNT